MRTLPKRSVAHVASKQRSMCAGARKTPLTEEQDLVGLRGELWVMSNEH
jgi:hypothetical protein